MSSLLFNSEITYSGKFCWLENKIYGVSDENIWEYMDLNNALYHAYR